MCVIVLSKIKGSLTLRGRGGGGEVEAERAGEGDKYGRF